MREPEHYQAFFERLGHELDIGVTDLHEGAQAVARYVCGLLQCSQASLWVLDGLAGARVMTCIGGHDQDAGTPLPPQPALADPECAPYFDALWRDGVLVAHDARQDVRLACLRDDYLVPQDVRSLLDASVGFNGTAVGVLCCEQRGAARRWTPGEIATVKRIAVEIAVRRARRRQREERAQGVADDLLGDWVVRRQPSG